MTSPECPLPQDSNVLEDEKPHPLQSLIEQTTERKTASDLQADLLGKQEMHKDRHSHIGNNMRKVAGNKLPKTVLPIAV